MKTIEIYDIPEGVIEEYSVPCFGKITITEKNGKYDVAHSMKNVLRKNILTGCETRGSARRASEGYLSALVQNEKIKLEKDITKSGWLKQYQTPTLENKHEGGKK